MTASCTMTSTRDSADVSSRDHNSLSSYLLSPLCEVLWQKFIFFLPVILSCQIKKPVAISGSVLLLTSPHPQDIKTRTTQWILQFYIYSWTFIIFKISTRFITINYTLLSKYIKH